MKVKNHIMKKAAIAVVFVTASMVLSGCGSKNSTLNAYKSTASFFNTDG